MTSRSERLSETEGRSGNSEQRRRLCKKEDHQNRDHKGQDPNEQENLFAGADFCRLADQRGRGIRATDSRSEKEVFIFHGLCYNNPCL